jgi:hypothetical protein
MGPNSTQRRLATLLSLIAGLLFIVVVELAMLLWPGVPSAQAQIPDSGLQRLQLLDAVERTNQKLDDLNKLLRTQVLKVKVVSTDNDKQTGRPPVRAPESR